MDNIIIRNFLSNNATRETQEGALPKETKETYMVSEFSKALMLEINDRDKKQMIIKFVGSEKSFAQCLVFSWNELGIWQYLDYNIKADVLRYAFKR